MTMDKQQVASSDLRINHKNCNPSNAQLLIQQLVNAQPAIACSKLTIETLEQGVKYVQS